LTIGFHVSPPVSGDLESELARQLEEIPSLALAAPVLISVQGRKATLRGEVASQRERRMIELLVRFEPGISQVQNELTVRDPARSAPPPPAMNGPPRAPAP
jgi:hypothetical protein